MSYMNSPMPHQMSTPMVNRTKDQYPGSYNQQQNIMNQSSNANQYQNQENTQLKQLQSECEIHFSGNIFKIHKKKITKCFI